jgi:hypothetical protein
MTNAAMRPSPLCPRILVEQAQQPLATWVVLAFVGLLLGVGALGWAAVGGAIPA